MRILYVEDNQANVFLVRRVAKMGDHEVMNYIDGEEALRKIDAINPDLILMDIQLSGALTGLDVVRKLRSDGHKMPIIAVTAYAMVGDMEKCLAAGCDDYLAKPLPIQRLVEIFERIERTFSTTEREAVIVKLQDEGGSLTGSLKTRTNEAPITPNDGNVAQPAATAPAGESPNSVEVAKVAVETPKPVQAAPSVTDTPVVTPKVETVAAPVPETPAETPKAETPAAAAEAPKTDVVTAPVPEASVETPKSETTTASTEPETITQPSAPDKVVDKAQEEETAPSTPKDVAVAVVAESRTDTPTPDNKNNSGEDLLKRADK
jgi:CheY-like chemotaxis protein